MIRDIWYKIEDLWYDTMEFREFLGKIPYLPIILISILCFNFFTEEYQFKENRPEITIDKTISLKTGKDTTEHKITLHKGDVVSLLGYENTSSMELGRLFVETQDGLRGYCYSYELGYPVVREEENDTVTIINRKPEETSMKALIRLADGQEETYSNKNLNVILPDEFYPFELGDERDCYLSENKFKTLFLGKTIQECDSLITPSMFVDRKKDGTYESYFHNLNVFNPEDGLFYMPIVFADENMIVQDYKFANSYGNNSFLLKHLPYAEQLIDCDFFARIIASPLYAHQLPKEINKYGTKTEDVRKVLGWVLTGFYILFGLLWLFCTEALIILLMRFAMQWRYSFYIFNNDMMKILFAIVAIVCTYVWFVLLLTYGLVWIVAWTLFLVAYFFYRYATNQLNDTIPHRRCVSCKRTDMIYLIQTNLLKEYQEWVTEEEKDYLGSGENLIKKEWNEKTYGDGRKEISDTKSTYRVTNNYRITYYKVLYNVKVFEDIYRCVCSLTERSERTERKELDRKKLGSELTSDSYTTTRNY